MKEEPDLITTGAGPEVQVGDIHLFETEGAFLVFLVSIERKKSAELRRRVISGYDG